MFPLPLVLHHQCQASLRALLSGAQDAVDSADVLTIGAWFGALSTPTPGLSPVQRRHMLMLLLTLRHVAPLWEGRVAHTTDAFSAVHVLQHLAGHVIHPLPHEAIGAAIDTAVAWAERQEQHITPNARNVAAFPISLYTATKAIEGCLYADLIAGYPAETHAGVAICLAAAAFADGWQGRAAWERRRAFWVAWLTHIIPTAWYPLADDRLDGLPISVPTPNTPF
jgi:hypothetical protein